MKQTYQVKGMTCQNCQASVEKKLSALAEVNQAEVDLKAETVELELNKAVSLEQLREALPAKYTISAVPQTKVSAPPPGPEIPAEKSKLEQLKPLFLILFYISVASILMHRHDWDMSAMMLDFMGLFLIVFSFFKMLDLKGFPDSFRMYDPLAKRLPIYGKVYPFLETLLGLMFLMRYQVTIAIIITIIILGITTIGVSKTLLDKRSIRCACLGTALNLPMTEATFIENAIMLVMAVALLIQFI